MNAGLGSLTDLKNFLLAEALRAGTEYDAALAIIGQGIAGLMDDFCNRKFGYAVNDQIIFTGDRPHYYLPRFPINESAAITVEMRYFLADAWTDITGQPISWNPQTGLLHFGYTLGRNPLQVRCTYTGGYWFDTTEDATGTLPAGATTLPASVKLAWLTQCADLWSKRDNLGLGLAGKPDERAKLGALELAPLIKTALQPFVRYQLT